AEHAEQYGRELVRQIPKGPGRTEHEERATGSQHAARFAAPRVDPVEDGLIEALAFATSHRRQRRAEHRQLIASTSLTNSSNPGVSCAHAMKRSARSRAEPSS